jgi:hypothetical protein
MKLPQSIALAELLRTNPDLGQSSPTEYALMRLSPFAMGLL